MDSHEVDHEHAEPTASAAAGPAPAEARGATSWETLLAAVALLACAAFVVYGTALRAPFIFDDRISVVQNPSIVKLWPLLGEKGASGPLTPVKDSVTAGRPLVNLSLALNYYFNRLDPAGYHAFNIVVHVLSALLLWAIVGRTLRLDYFGARFDQAAGPLALMVALLWELHPLQTEAVEYVSQRTELMMGFFYLATLYATLRYWVAPAATRGAWLVVATLACLLGMACKEVMVTAPVIVLLFDRTFLAGSFHAALKKSWPLYLGLSLGWLLLFALNYGGPRSGSAGLNVGVTPFVWWLTQAKVLWIYLKLVVWPWPLVIHYEMPYLGGLAVAWPWVLLGAFLGITTLVLLWRRSGAGFLAACLLLILSPTLVVPIPTEMAAERRMYLPLAALAALAVVGGYALVERLRHPFRTEASAVTANPVETSRAEASPAEAAQTAQGWSSIHATVVAALVLATLFGLISVRRLAAYRDIVTFWQDTAIHQPDNAIVLVTLGAALSGAGRYDEAIEALRHADELHKDSPALGIHKQLGVALSAAGRSQEAMEQLRLALELDPNAAGVDRVLGANLLHTGRTKEAIEHFERAVSLQPDVAEIRDNLGAALLNGDRTAEAIASFEQALRIEPDLLGARFNLALAYAKAGRRSEAIAAGQKAAELARSTGAHETAAQVEGWLKQYRESPPAP